MPVTENEFNRLKISGDSIQIVDLTKNKDSSRYTDNSKRGKKFTDMNGEKYFWVNPNPTGEVYGFDKGRQDLNQSKHQTKKENLTDNSKVEKNKLTEAQELEALINDPEIKNLIKDFNSSFQVRWRYYVLGEDIFDNGINQLRKKGEEIFSNLLEIKKYPNGTILKDKKLNKEVLVIGSRLGIDNGLESFLSNIPSGIKGAIKLLISFSYSSKMLNTLEEKKDFIRPYFTDSIPNAIKNLPKYKVPLIYKEEWLMVLTEGKPVNYKNNIKLDSAKPAKSVDMNEQKLDEILKGE